MNSYFFSLQFNLYGFMPWGDDWLESELANEENQ